MTTDMAREAVEPDLAAPQPPDDGAAGIVLERMIKPPRGRRSPAKRFLKSVVRAVKRANRTCSRVGNAPVYDNALFPWVAELERGWRPIRAELEAVLERQADLPGFHELLPGVGTITRDTRWRSFAFCGYGIRSEANIARCPETWRALQKIPGLKSAMFSILEPGKHIPAHKGPYNGVLRLHLGLIVPEPRDRIWIRVKNRTVHWEEGRAVVFDDTYEHEVFNRTAGTRVVLFADFVKPLGFPGNLLNWIVVNAAPFTPLIREGYRKQKEWERRFYAGR